MSISMTRRVAFVSVASGLVVSAVALGAAPVGAAPHHATAPHRAAVPAAAKVIASSLTKVSVAPKSTDAWAYGSQQTKTTFGPYVVRRTKSDNWSKVSAKFPGTSPQVEGIAAGSPKSVWLVGESTTKSGERGYILRSKGGAFKSVSLKALSPGSNIAGIDASSASNAWAFGTTTTGVLILHWNGHTWRTVRFPKGKGGVVLTPEAVSTSGPTNTWFLSASDGFVTVRWNGHKFTLATVPVPLTTGSVTTLATGSPKNTWVAGFNGVTKGTTTRTETLTFHWNGHKWVRVASPTPYYNSVISSIAASGSHAYAVGSGTPKVFKIGLPTSAFALRLSKGHWHSGHVTQRGKVTSLVSVDASSKLAQAVGLWSHAPQCTAKFVSEPLVESLSGSSWHAGSAPKFRYGIANLRMTPAVPQRPAC